MGTLLILFILIGLGIFGTLEYYKIRLDMVPRKTSPQVISALVSLLGVPENEDDPGGRILHLGSGFGDMVMALSKKLPVWEIDGLEQNPALWLLCNLRSIGKQSANFRFFLGDFTAYPLRNYDVIFINQEQKIATRWETSIARRLPLDVLVVTLNSRLPHVKPINTIAIADKMTLYVYEKRPKEQAVSADVVPQDYTVDQAAPAFSPADIPPSPQPELPLQPQPQMVPETSQPQTVTSEITPDAPHPVTS
jgi:hypothetical protein